jgi:CheY-like chemotaxis protein
MTKILLVEDDPLIYRMYQKLFTLEGYETETANNGQEGLDKLKDFKPDIIMLDIMMPTMDGVTMLNLLKENPETSEIPVVILTNVADQRIANQTFEKGASLSIVKSETEPEQVIAWIKSVLAKKPAQDQDAQANDQADDAATDQADDQQSTNATEPEVVDDAADTTTDTNTEVPSQDQPQDDNQGPA